MQWITSEDDWQQAHEMFSCTTSESATVPRSIVPRSHVEGAEKVDADVNDFVGQVRQLVEHAGVIQELAQRDAVAVRDRIMRLGRRRQVLEPAKLARHLTQPLRALLVAVALLGRRLILVRAEQRAPVRRDGTRDGFA